MINVKLKQKHIPFFSCEVNISQITSIHTLGTRNCATSFISNSYNDQKEKKTVSVSLSYR